MTTPIPIRLRAIRTFLERDILPGVSTEMRSDMRATIKMLVNMEAEVDRLPSLIDSETREMLRLCEIAIAALGHQNLADGQLDKFYELVRQTNRPVSSQGDVLTHHGDLTMLLGLLAVQLSDRIATEPVSLPWSSAPRTIFNQCCRFLRRQAQARASWQSVFPHGGLYSEDQVEAAMSGETG